MEISELSERDRAVLRFEERWGSTASAAKEEAIITELGLRMSRYYQLLHAVIDTPAAIAEMPELVKRLHRLRDRRSAARAARVLVSR